MRKLPKLGALSISVVAMLVSATLRDGVSAQTIDNSARLQWRDITYELLGAGWQRVRDPSSKPGSNQLTFTRQEALHDIKLNVTSFEAPPALAPSEVAAQYFAEHQQMSRPDGTFSDFNSGQRTIAGFAYPAVGVRFIPTAGPPIVDQADILVFPSDYDQRQRWLAVQWSDNHSAITGPTPYDELDAFVANLGMVPLGSVLLADNFSDPDNGALSDNGASEHYDASYQNGEFSIQKTAPDFDGVYVSGIPGTYADTAMAVDARVTEAGYGPLEYLWCRRSTAGSYRATVDPSDGSAHLIRLKADGTSTELAPWITSAAINTGTDSNHLELICSGSLIELDANGTPVLAVRDTDLSEGDLSIGAGGFTDYDVVPEVRFANLTVTQR